MKWRHDVKFSVSKMCLGVAIVVFVSISIFVYKITRASLDQEDNLHSSLIVSRLVISYVKEKRKWPHEWGDLASIKAEGSGGLNWPQDRMKISSRVEIDFSSGPCLNDVLRGFLIRSKGPCPMFDFYVRDPLVFELKDLLKE